VVTGGWSEGERDTPIDALARAVAERPDHVFLDFSGKRLTYAEVDRTTNALAHGLAELGVVAGQTVVTMLDNNADAVCLWLAVNKLGAISVPLNTALRGEFLRHQVDDAGAALVVAEGDYVERILAVADGLPNVDRVLARGEPPAVGRGGLEVDRLDEHRGSDEGPVDHRPAPSDTALLIYTSGTTGPSKGCVLSFNYLCNLARLKLRGAPAAASDVTITPLPLFHLNAIVSGVTATMLTKGSLAFMPRFSVSRFWPEVERTGATIANLLGGLAAMLARAEDNEAMLRCRGQVHTVRGNPIHGQIKEIWRTRFGAVHVGSMDYGLTEAAVVTSLGPGEDLTAPDGSSGRRNGHFDVRIVDDEDREVPVGSTGEVIVRPLRPDVMFGGYWNRPADTVKVLRNLWFHTGDIGRFDEAGYFYFVDRKKDYLRRRGENISSQELETTFLSHPDIEEVAVHAVGSPVGEDEVKVTAVLRGGATLTEPELCRWCLDKVPYFAVPRFIEFRDELPKNPQGRVLKYQLRDEGRTAATWDREESDIEIARR
jgi:crotonobetaine/carnitine-CoA ligase